jgi:hypothetical protein
MSYFPMNWTHNYHEKKKMSYYLKTKMKMKMKMSYYFPMN